MMASPRHSRDQWQTFGPSTPIAVEGGLSTSKARGAMAESWWSKRFVAVLESFGLGGRMQRGRTYARKGQIISLETNPGLLVAQVQGSRPTPYVVTIRTAEPTPAQWLQIDAVIRSRVKFVASLLDGEVPPELEDAFSAAGVALFPTTWREVNATCNCPDYENPCKHIAAALYLFADRLDADPWLLLEWRGRTRQQVLADLRGVGAGTGSGDAESGAAAAAAAIAPWWPLVPGTLHPLASMGVLSVLAADPPEDPTHVLARLDPLPLDGTEPSDRLTAAYESLLQP